MHMDLIAHLETNAQPTLSLFERIKTETRQIHDKIENLELLLSSAGNLDSYVNHLAKLLGFFIPLEEQLSAFLSTREPVDVFETPSRLKSHLLISDLMALGENAERLNRVSLCHLVHPVTSVPECIGVLYAFESLTLSSGQIQRQLRSRLGLDPWQMRYYSAYGNPTYEMWSKLRFQAENAVPDYAQGDAVIAARNTFIALLDCLEA